MPIFRDNSHVRPGTLYLTYDETKRLNRARVDKYLSYRMLAGKVGCTLNEVSNYLKNNIGVPMEVFADMCHVLDVTPREVLTGESGHIEIIYVKRKKRNVA